ncbi:MAG: cupin domain-containing protein [Lachnospirales bacterium]
MTFFHEDNIEFEVLEMGKIKRKIKAFDGSLMTVEVYFEDGAQGYTHQHVHEQICYCLEGEFDFTVEDITKKIKSGDSIYIKSNIPHGCKLLSHKGRLLDIFTPIREDFLK